MAMKKQTPGISGSFGKLCFKVLIAIFVCCLIVSGLLTLLKVQTQPFLTRIFKHGVRGVDHDMSNPEFVLQIQTGSPPVHPDDWRLLNHIRKVMVKPSVQPLKLKGNPNVTHYSQLGQSKIIDKLLNGRRGGFFVECGASDGETFSNSLFFERWRSWRGLLIEANPWRYKSILEGHHHSYALHACLSTTNQTQAMDFRLSVRGGSFEDISKWQYFNTVDKTIPVYPLQCYPLYSVLLALGVRHVDYFSLDVEGSELNVLKTLPFGVITIDSLTIEFRTFNSSGLDYEVSEQKLEGIKRFMEETKMYDYRGVLPENSRPEYTAVDAVFVRKDVGRFRRK